MNNYDVANLGGSHANKFQGLNGAFLKLEIWYACIQRISYKQCVAFLAAVHKKMFMNRGAVNKIVCKAHKNFFLDHTIHLQTMPIISYANLAVKYIDFILQI